MPFLRDKTGFTWETQIGLFCANKPSEVYPNTHPLYPTPYIHSLRTFIYRAF